MARKQRPSHLHDPPAVSSPTEEEEEETLSDDEEGEQEGVGKPEEDEEEGEQSSSEEEAEAAKIESLPVKPHSETKPMEPESRRSTRSSTMKKKRPNSETETTPSKRVKKKDPKSQGGGGGGGGGEEKKLFQRLWSDDNEIELLKGMLDYRVHYKFVKKCSLTIHDSDPAVDAAAFYEFVKKSPRGSYQGPTGG